MASIAQLYSNKSQRQSCYSCSRGKGVIEQRGKEMRIECRHFTKKGNMLETQITARQSDLFEKELIHIVDIGVDTAEFESDKEMRFKTQSRGGGGLSKYECGNDYQIPEIVRHKKYGYTEMLYVHYKDCPRQYIGTELQDMIFEDDMFDESYNTDNMFVDMVQLGARQTISNSLQYVDIIGIYGSANEDANMYDGILAQAYWAYTRNAYFNSVQYEVDETELTTGKYIHAKYAGLQLTVLFDSSQASDASINRFATYAEVYQRIVDWLNFEVKTEGGRKFVDATYTSNRIIVTSKWTEATVNLQLNVSSSATVNWLECETYNGVIATTLQGTMPIDERPHLVKWQRYTLDNILKELPNDIYLATRDMDSQLLNNGQRWVLYIDEYVWKMYRQARSSRTNQETQQNLEDDFTVYTLNGLSQNGGTGIWFVTASSQREVRRNVAHLIDTRRAGMAPIDISISDDCRELKVLYEVLHGVLVKDFRKFASNLLCSPFASLLQEPYEKTIKVLPCYNKRVREEFDRFSSGADCNLEASFRKVAEYRNAALYAVPNAVGGFDIRVLEAGGTLPTGALAVYEIKFEDTSTGIPADKLASTTYEYEVTTSDGMSYTLTDKNPIVQYIGSAAGIAFNITQTVAYDNCESNYDASLDYGQDYPFVMSGGCNALDLNINGRFDRTSVYFVDSGAGYDVDIRVETPSGVELIDLSGNGAADAEGAAVIVNQWLSDNGYAGNAQGVGTLLTVYSPDVIFETLDPVGVKVDFTEEISFSVFDQTIYDEFDGLDSVELKIWCQPNAEATATIYDELVVNEIAPVCGTGGWNVKATVTTKLGCTFVVTAAVDNFATQSVNFELA
jgi:hypothetical protein